MFQGYNNQIFANKTSISISLWIGIKLLILFWVVLFGILFKSGSLLQFLVPSLIQFIIAVYILKKIGCDFLEIYQRYNNKIKHSLIIVFKYFAIFILIILIIGILSELIFLLIDKLFLVDFSAKFENFLKSKTYKEIVFQNAILNSKVYFGIYLISICFLGPIAEEIIYRRLLYVSLRKKMSFIYSLFISSTIFGIFHCPDIIVPFMAGLLLGYMYEKEQNMLSNIIFHGLKNFLAIIFMGFI